MRTNNSRYMQEVLSTMANYDHELAAKIWNSDVVITVVDNPMQMLEDAMKRRVQPMLAMALVQNMGGASGLTIRPDPRTKDIAPEMLPVSGDIWLRSDAIEMEAEHADTTWQKSAVATLAHEWKHHEGYNEAEGYDAGAAMARLMGEETMARHEEETKVKGVAIEKENERRAAEAGIPAQRSPLEELIEGLIREGYGS